MRSFRLLSLTALASLGLAGSAAATSEPDVDVIATGLDNPRHVALSDWGDVYVAESGRGGDPATATSCFDSAEGFACTGDTGAVTRISRHRWHFHQNRIVTGLASFAPANGSNAIGPHGVFVDGDDVYVTNGGPTAPTRDGEVVLRDPTLVSEDPVSALYGTLLKVRKHGHVRQVADLWAFENQNNPDAEVGTAEVDSNPVDVLARHGRFVVADAGGNTLLRVSRGGEVELLSLFPNVPTPGPGGAVIPMNAVPTGVVAGPDRALYMSQLTGFPFPVGGAQIFRVDPHTGEYTTYADGFTNVIDLDFGRDGTLYVLEHDSDSILGPATEGGLWTVPPGGGTPVRVELPAGTLTTPGGIAVGRHGDVYVSNRSTEAGTGEVLEIELDHRHH